MAQTEAQKAAQARYRAKGRTQINIELNPSDRDDWKSFAESMGQTLPGMVRQAVKEYMAAHGWEKNVEQQEKK